MCTCVRVCVHACMRACVHVCVSVSPALPPKSPAAEVTESLHARRVVLDKFGEQLSVALYHSRHPH